MDGGIIAFLDVSSKELSTLGKADGIESILELGDFGKLVADFGELLADAAEEGGGAVGVAVGAEADDVCEGAGVGL